MKNQFWPGHWRDSVILTDRPTLYLKNPKPDWISSTSIFVKHCSQLRCVAFILSHFVLWQMQSPANTLGSNWWGINSTVWLMVFAAAMVLRTYQVSRDSLHEVWKEAIFLTRLMKVYDNWNHRDYTVCDTGKLSYFSSYRGSEQGIFVFENADNDVGFCVYDRGSNGCRATLLAQTPSRTSSVNVQSTPHTTTGTTTSTPPSSVSGSRRRR